MSTVMFHALIEACIETLLMVFAGGCVAVLLGLPLGVLLVITRHHHIMPRLVLNRTLAVIVNAVRSVPFVILMLAIIPLTRLIVGTSIGTVAAIVPLALAAVPFFARLVESALKEVSPGLIEASQAMGATPLQIITKVLLPEALPGIIRAVTITVVTLVGYSAMAGYVGGGGLGDLAYRYGYERFEVHVMIITVIVLIALVQLIQWIGDRLALHWSHDT